MTPLVFKYLGGQVKVFKRMNNMSWIPKEIENYCLSHCSSPSDIAKELQHYTLTNIHGSHMLIGQLEGSLLQFLIRLGKVKKILEFGTYTGYSSLIMAEAMPDDGRLITVDINPHTTKIAKEFWNRSPHGKKIDLILKPGREALPELSSYGPFDLIFIDADKNGYPQYLDWGVNHLSSRGMIITDNTLWSGKILSQGLDPQTDSIRLHNEKARELKGFTKTLLPIRDGMYLIQKVSEERPEGPSDH